MGSAVKTYKETFAFEMNSLTKLSGTKAVDNTTTLLHFLAEKMDEECLRTEASFQDFTIGDFANVIKATKVSQKDLEVNINSMKNSIKQLESELESYQPQDQRDRFKSVMEPFVKEAKSTFELLEEMHKNMLRKYSDLAKYYAIDEKKYPMEEFFADLKTFKEQYESARRDNDKKKEKLKPKPKRIQPEKPTTNKKVSRQEFLDLTRADDDCEGLMDNLMEALKDGRAFPQRGKTPMKRTPRSGESSKRVGISRQRSRHIHPSALSFGGQGEEIDPSSSRQQHSFPSETDPAPSGVTDGNRNLVSSGTGNRFAESQPGMKVRRKERRQCRLAPRRDRRSRAPCRPVGKAAIATPTAISDRPSLRTPPRIC